MNRPERDPVVGRPREEPGGEATAHAYPFVLDPFQRDALDAVDAGHHVVVSAPTGSGKTVVAEHALHRARRHGRRAFYTTPVKALSNQKFRDLGSLFGDDQVGLLTGDTSIRSEAGIVVMTTEVVRNMIYGGSRALDELGVVVLDEVHYLQDAYRGPVWEEVIIHLPTSVQLVCLSATVSNSGQLAAWMETVRGPTTAIVEHHRPVQLEQHYAVGDTTRRSVRLVPILLRQRPNPDGSRFDRAPERRRERGSGPNSSVVPDRGARTEQPVTPSRVELARALASRSWLPAIHFVFSRHQCEVAAAACVDAGLVLTDDAERARIHEIASERLDDLDRSDLAVLGYDAFLGRLSAGIAAHHAGMVPPFKEVVEICFTEGLVKLVFATETLAVGINMPARTVVIDSLSKYTGARHERLTPAEYTQLTGRAGRRGIDELGHAVVAWSPYVPFSDVATLALSREFHLRSAFRPTYNMAANLIRRRDEADTLRVLDLSFAQYQADREVVELHTRLERMRTRFAELHEQAVSPFGNLEEYRQLTAADRALEDPRDSELSKLRPGDVIPIDTGKHRCPAAVVSTAHRRTGVRLTVITPSAAALRLTAAEFKDPPPVIGHIRLPHGHAPDRRSYRQEVARRIRTADLGTRGRRARQRAGSNPPEVGHPVEEDPDLSRRLRAADKADRTEREIAALERRITAHRHSLTTAFRGIVEILRSRGYVAAEEWRLTDHGEVLARVFHESDLLICEAMRYGMFDGLEPPDLAAIASVFVYEHRSADDPPMPWFPSDVLVERFGIISRISAELAVAEQTASLPVHRGPDPGFIAVAHGWVAGGALVDVLDDEPFLAAGDVVRSLRQLIDLLGQLAMVAPEPDTRRQAQRALDAAWRDVIVDAIGAGGS